MQCPYICGTLPRCDYDKASENCHGGALLQPAIALLAKAEACVWTEVIHLLLHDLDIPSADTWQFMS